MLVAVSRSTACARIPPGRCPGLSDRRPFGVERNHLLFLLPWTLRVPALGFTFYVLRVAFCLLLLLSNPATAHDRTTSYSTWDIRGRGAQVTVRLAAIDATRFPWAATAGADVDRLLGDYLARHLRLLADGSPCAVADGPRRLSAPPGRVVFEWRVACPESGTLQIRSALLLDVAPAHLHFARVTRDGTHAQERVLSDAERVWPLSDASPLQRTVEPSGTSLGGYIVLGIEHILSGYDHLAFLLALLLVGGSIRDVARMVTGFTVGHSMTLALTVLGYVHPERAPVEALIGLSIALVAAENEWLVGTRSRAVPWAIAGGLALMAIAAARGHGQVPALTLAGLALFTLCYFGLLQQLSRAASQRVALANGKRLVPSQDLREHGIATQRGAVALDLWPEALPRWAIAFIFGLVHGCGFAAVLGEAGLPPDRVVHALFGFNVGVELGQLVAVALAWPVLQWVTHRRARVRAAFVEVGSAAVLALGIFWFVTRAFG
jgi:hypothetical protein